MKKYLIFLLFLSLFLSCSTHRRNETRIAESSASQMDSTLISRLQTMLLQKTLRERDRDSIGCLERISIRDSVVTILDPSGKVLGREHFRSHTRATDISRNSARSSEGETEAVLRDTDQKERRRASESVQSEKKLKEEKTPPQTLVRKRGVVVISILLFAVGGWIWVRRKNRKRIFPRF